MLKSLDETELPKTESEDERKNNENHYYSQVPSLVNEDIESGWQPREYLDTKLLVAPSYGKSHGNIYPPNCIDILRSSILVKGSQLKKKGKCCECNDKFITYLSVILFLFLTISCLTVWCLYFTNVLQNNKNYNTDIKTFENPEKSVAPLESKNQVRVIRFFHHDDIDPTAAINKENNHELNTNNELESGENHLFPPALIPILRHIFSSIPFPFMSGDPSAENHENNTEMLQPNIIRIRIFPIHPRLLDHN